MMKNRTYRVAPLLHHEDCPEFFEDYEEAEEKAVQNSIDDGLWGVWDEKTGNLEAIGYQSSIYSQ